ncbi:hypothetical protein [Muricauda sp. MAR_2010_75]|uniref:hypothetical protein n=1 Tax=Allomuricauda sp. MAR_2010_75 TaxID=1250232 RepID=UPI00056D8470|nr:hypothetical protein [Muricauda sp. MAR_2010_75]
MKSIYLTKHPSYLKNSFVEIKVHSDYWKIGLDYEVLEYGTDNYLTTAQIVHKETIRLEELSDHWAYLYLDAPKQIVKEIWRNRVKNHAFVLFDIILFSNYAASQKFYVLNDDNHQLFKGLKSPVKLNKTVCGKL